MTRRQLAIMAICVGLFAIGQFHRAAGGIMAPLWAREFDLGPDQLGFMIGLIFVATIVAQAPISSLMDRVGPRTVLTVSMVVLAIGTAMMALAKTDLALGTARVAIGVGLSATGVGMFVLIARDFPKDRFGQVNGHMVMIGGLGGLVATWPLAALIDLTGWRPVLLGLTVLTLLFGGAVFALTRPDPTTASPRSTEHITWSELVRTPGLWRVFVLATMTFAPLATLTGLWGAPYLIEVHDFTLQQAGAVLFAMFATTMFGGWAFGMIDGRGFSRRKVIAGAVATSASALALLSLSPGLPVPLAIAALVLMIFSQQFYIPLMAILRDAVPTNGLARASGLFSILGVGAIPLCQTAFGSILALGPAGEDAWRLAFGVLAAAIVLVALPFLLGNPLRDSP